MDCYSSESKRLDDIPASSAPSAGLRHHHRGHPTRRVAVPAELGCVSTPALLLALLGNSPVVIIVWFCAAT